MKKIVVGLSPKSIKNAIKELKKIKSRFVDAKQDALKFIAQWIIDKANTHLSNSLVGSSVIFSISQSWNISIIGGVATITNTSDKAVFVEFGVGVVGEGSSHPNANKEGYMYNVPSVHKFAGKQHDENTWRFHKDDLSEVDLADGYYEAWPRAIGALKIITRGSPAALYAYNALVDARNDLRNPNGAIQTEWKKIKRRHLV